MLLILFCPFLIFQFASSEKDFLLEPHDKPGEVPCDIDGGEPCGINEICIANSTDARIGFCKCAMGYELQDAQCVPDNIRKGIEFTVEGPALVHIPIESVDLRVVFRDPTAKKKFKYNIHWDLVMGNGLATSLSYNEDILHLTDLREGSLQFRVTVFNTTHSEKKDFVLAVKPQKLKNKPPSAVIRPESPVHGVEGSQVVLDAEGSSDDKSITSYKWTQDNGPSINLPVLDTPVLKLDNLVQGTYTFTVVVTDEEKLSANASVHVIIDAERDDPPKSVITLCGTTDTGSITVRLPFEVLRICGNSSTDDKGIVSYSWFRVDKLVEKLTVDTTGTSTSFLSLTNVQANEKLGPYEFQLDVTDSKGQKDSSRVSIFVNKAENMLPVVNAGGNRTVFLPETSIVLDALVKDDGTIVAYEWSQLSGPSSVVIANKDKSKATFSQMLEGVYQFKLEVIDDGGLKANDTVFISVQRSSNEPPVAKANNVTVKLPQAVAILNGTLSSDDAGITSYKWEPAENVPAGMIALDGSENKAVLFISGLVKGNHLYTLTVFDHQKASNSTTVVLNIEQGDEDLESIELILEKSLEWTYRLRSKLQARLASVISSAIPEVASVNIHFSQFGETTDGFLRAVFWASTNDNADRMKRSAVQSNGVIKAQSAVTILENEWSMFSEFKIVSVRTLYCKLDCSGHGHCSDTSKECVCDHFWMSNLFLLLSNNWKKKDCAWSSVYFWLISSMLSTLGFFWLIFKRRMSWFGRVTRRRFRRRKRYSAVKSDSDNDADLRHTRLEPRLKPLPIPSSSESLHSESDDLLVDTRWSESLNPA